MKADKGFIQDGFRAIVEEAQQKKEAAANNNLASWLLHPGFRKCLGRSVSMKLEIFSAVISGKGNLAKIAENYGVSREATSKIARRFKRELPCQPQG